MPKNYYQVEGYKARQSVGFLLRRASKLISQKIETFFDDAEDLTFVQWVILMHLREGISTTSAELCAHLCHDSGALTRIIDQMEKRSLLARRRSTEDRRVIELALTTPGRKLAEKYLPLIVSLYNSLFEDFTQEEADKTIELLTRVVQKLSDHP